MRLCSACLLGMRCRYDGKSKSNIKVIALSKKEVLIPICPEQLGGLSTPRLSAEISGRDGSSVLEGKSKVLLSNGTDVTRFFIRGAEEVLRIATLLNAKDAILKQRSPSCGSGQVYDGSFSKNIVKGDGVTTALLKRNGIEVISEDDI